MSANYYYFVSSLPMLRFGDTPEMSSQQFLEQCAYQLSPNQLQILTDIQLPPSKTNSCPVQAKWNAFETALRNITVQARAAKQKMDPHPFMGVETDAFGGLEGQVLDALNRDPLTMEQQLDRTRWQFLDDQMVGHDFDFNTLVAYRIKLLLLEKRADVTTEQGRDELERCLNEKLTSDQLPEFING